MPTVLRVQAGSLMTLKSPMLAALQDTGIMDAIPSLPLPVATVTMRRGYSREQSI